LPGLAKSFTSDSVPAMRLQPLTACVFASQSRCQARGREISRPSRDGRLCQHCHCGTCPRNGMTQSLGSAAEQATLERLRQPIAGHLWGSFPGLAAAKLAFRCADAPEVAVAAASAAIALDRVFNLYLQFRPDLARALLHGKEFRLGSMTAGRCVADKPFPRSRLVDHWLSRMTGLDPPDRETQLAPRHAPRRALFRRSRRQGLA
jgi:hypothetical protein